MKILIYSDVHGNLPAFEQMLKIEEGCDGYICLGDLVNYGPWSNECVDLAMSLPNSTFIMGNHEEAFLDGHYPVENPLVQAFFEQCFPRFERQNGIRTFVDKTELKEFVCTHTINNQYVYPDTDIALNNNYIIGHSHHQFLYANSEFKLYNAGSVGQNRKFINEVNYLVYHSEEDRIDLKSTIYDFDLLISKMKSLNYPGECLRYYLDKKMR